MWFKTKSNNTSESDERWNKYREEKKSFSKKYVGGWVDTKLGLGIILSVDLETNYDDLKIVGISKVRVFDIDVAYFYEYEFDEVELINPSETEKAELKKRYLATLREYHLKDEKVYRCNCD